MCMSGAGASGGIARIFQQALAGQLPTMPVSSGPVAPAGAQDPQSPRGRATPARGGVAPSSLLSMAQPAGAQDKLGG